MPTERRCSRCSAPLTSVGGADLCLGCLLEAGLVPPGPDRPLGAGTIFAETESAPVATGVGEARMFGDYELLEEIARGGMGVVYRARQRSLDRLVAVKMLLFGPHASADLIRRFKTEAVAAGGLHHPNIVAVHEVGLRDGRHYIVMDYVDGPNLAQLVKDRPPPSRQAALYLRTIAEAVHHAHEHGVLHRDLKPSNVLMDARDQPHVTDFGLARRLETDSSLTVTGQVLGSPNFMPPEQVTGTAAKVGRRSDVYGLGATLYHLLTGRPPFQGESLQATLHQVLTAEPVSPRLLNPGVPRDLETLCLKCLEKESARRYATAQELADELGRFLRDEPIQARPVSRPERVWRWARRKPVLALLILLVHVVGTAGLAGIVWQWLRAEQNATEAQTQRDTAEGRLYAAQLRLAHAEYRAGRLGSARQRLEAWEPTRRAPGRPDWRGFEWRWLQRLCAASPGEVIATNASGFTAVAASPDGASLALGAHDGTIRLLDASTTTPGASWRAHPGPSTASSSFPARPTGWSPSAAMRGCSRSGTSATRLASWSRPTAPRGCWRTPRSAGPAGSSRQARWAEWRSTSGNSRVTLPVVSHGWCAKQAAKGKGPRRSRQTKPS
ncbi:MAG: serine/threonine-protein kinase [Verrucomicrobia bacterium]|nr:serine/threonine-protein kinase [Verrucomicrobiota bacterium]